MKQNNIPENGQLKENSLLGRSWNLSESYQSDQQKTFQNFANTHNSIYDFSTVGEFALFWKVSDYSMPSNLFYDEANSNIRKFKVKENDNEEKVIDGISLFKKGVNAAWEDPENQNGCSFDINLKNLVPEEIDQIWRNLVMELVTENFPFVQYVTGIRCIDRLKKHSCIRVEIWISVGLKAYKPESDDYFRNDIIIKTITDHFLMILNKTATVSDFELTRHEHAIRLKVN